MTVSERVGMWEQPDYRSTVKNDHCWTRGCNNPFVWIRLRSLETDCLIFSVLRRSVWFSEKIEEEDEKILNLSLFRLVYKKAMDKQSVSARHNHHNNNSNSSNRDRNGADGSLLLRAASSDAIGQSTPSDFVLQWGNRKRLRCMKIQVKDDSSAPVHRTTVRVDRRVVRADKDANHPTTTIHNNNNNTNGYLNLRQRPPSPQQPPSHRVLSFYAMCCGNCVARSAWGFGTVLVKDLDLVGNSDDKLGLVGRLLRLEFSAAWGADRCMVQEERAHGKCMRPPSLNSETSSAMRGQSNGGVRGIASPDRGAHDKKGTTTNNNNNHHHHNENNKSAASSETAHDSKKGGSSSGSGEAAVAPPVWPPKFVIALTNKEKEEDFIAFKGSKLPQRPKKRAKFIQRTLNLVSPGAWLCDLTLERYEVREKKISKKRPRGLKAMGNMESDSE
ncbi:hypothetical protein FEM48_Zijuj06G0049800 [Ziziphus jujuba var. spinosa]|uniref:Uncharacterized protein n=1 Tax=Ziziphus jujuba var. spinosa TaxID=714518 RepID=A0A978V7A8_ZIZJJ|nr:hypothetical protein FEM48_Zijuj06G0049800 [Ziziphus jujuba var. spinosa]